MISAPSSSRASLRRPFTAACVPTGRKNGDWTTPWGVVRRPRRAPDGSVFAISNEKFTLAVYQEKTHATVVPSNVKNKKTPTAMPADFDIGSFFGSMQWKPIAVKTTDHIIKTSNEEARALSHFGSLILM